MDNGGDGEFEFLLREQERFLSSDNSEARPAAKLVRRSQSPSESAQVENAKGGLSVFRQGRLRQRGHLKEGSSSPASDDPHRMDRPSDVARAELNQMNIDEEGQRQLLADIVEHNYDASDSQDQVPTDRIAPTSSYSDVPQEGFPVPRHRAAVKRTPVVAAVAGEQHMASNNEDRTSVLRHQQLVENSQDVSLWSESQPNRVVKDSRRAFESETEAYISQMSSEEIRLAQEEILEKLGPDLVNKIRERQKREASEKVKTQPKREVHFDPIVEVELPVKQTEELQGLPQPTAKLRLDEHEALKLEWTEPVGDPCVEDNNSATTRQLPPLLNLRFDTSGNCLSKQQHSPKTAQGGWGNKPGINETLSLGTIAAAEQGLVDRDLYHHGEEPDRPGYTLKELVYYWLCSVNPRQRVMALRMVEAITSKAMNELSDGLDSTQSVQIQDCLLHRIASTDRHHSSTCLGYGRKTWDR